MTGASNIFFQGRARRRYQHTFHSTEVTPSGIMVGKPVELKKQPIRWLFLHVNREGRPLKIKTQPRATLWKKEDLHYIQEPPTVFMSEAGMWRRRGSHAYLSKISLTVLISSPRALLVFGPLQDDRMVADFISDVLV